MVGIRVARLGTEMEAIPTASMRPVQRLHEFA